MSDKNSINVKIQASSYEEGILKRTCPNCNIEKTMEAFGIRKMGEDKDSRNQSWCSDCR